MIGGKNMAMKLYIGNLSFDISDEELKKVFSSFGEIEEATIIKDKFSGRSKGFGFVTFKDEESAKQAISEMNEKEIEGRALKVNEAKPMDPDRPRREFSRGPPRREFGNRRRY